MGLCGSGTRLNCIEEIYLKEEYGLSKTDALVIVDVQNDFCPSGALPVPEGDKVVPFLNDYIQVFSKAKAKFFASRDWHPPNHVSFITQGGPWPPHCVQETEGAKFHPDLKLPNNTTIVSKATDPLKEAYSAFESTQLANILRSKEINRIFIGGLATDYCVKNTVLDALNLNFKAVVLADAIRGINSNLNDSANAIQEMINQGAEDATLMNFPEDLEIPPIQEPSLEDLAEKPITKIENKKRARMRPRGRYKQIRTERG